MDQRTLYNLSLCTGGAGLDLGLQLALGSVRTICCVEWEAFAIEYLASAMEAGCLDQAPIWTDLRTFDGFPWHGIVDCITAGYPCQPFSVAGKRRGSDDPRHLWPHVARVVGEAEPGIVFLENVSGHLSLGFEQVAQDLEGLDYEVAAGLFSAEEVGASQKRDRLFILAVAHTQRAEWRADGSRAADDSRSHADRPQGSEAASTDGQTLGDGQCAGLEEWSSQRSNDESQQSSIKRTGLSLFPPGPDELEKWRQILREDEELAPAQPAFCFMADGLAKDCTNYLRLLGNGVVPLQAAYAFCSLWAALREVNLCKS